MRKVELKAGSKTVPIFVGHEIDVEQWWPKNWKKVLIVSQEPVPILFDPPCEHRCVIVEDGEQAKDLKWVEYLAREAVKFGLTRQDGIVAIGGGVVCDLAGFVASVYYRGIGFVNAATTLLAMVDAAIGGKTGVNLPEGKNLVGSFWQPEAVVCDLRALDSLPEREWRSGRGEMAKYRFLGAPDLLSLPLLEQVEQCVRVKVDFVSSDERESGQRALLNYGHTLGHAIEGACLARGNHDITHGEAVANGLVFAAWLARRMGRISEQRFEAHVETVSAFGLSPFAPSDLPVHELVSFMKVDKKARNGLTFVLDGDAGLEVVSGLDEQVVRVALEEYLSWSERSGF